MASLKDFHARLKPLIDLNKLQGFVAEEVDKEVTKLKDIKKNEFQFGLRPNYKKIGEYANPDYAYKKFLKNSLAGLGQVDLMDTGAFVNSFFIKRDSRSVFSFDASNNKKDWLIDKFGKDIMSINQKSFDKIQKEIIAPKFFARLTRELGR